MKIGEIIESIQRKYSLESLDSIDSLIFQVILITGFGALGNSINEFHYYIKSRDFIKNAKDLLINSKEYLWYYYYVFISAKMEKKRKNFSVAYDMLKQSQNYFMNINEKTKLDMLMLGNINILLGEIHKETNYLDIAVNNFKKVIEWGLKAHNLEYARRGYLNLSLVYEEQGKEYLAIQTCEELIQLIEQEFCNDQFSLSSAYNLLGNIYNRIGEFFFAKDYYLRAFSVLTDTNLLQNIRSFNLNNMGVISFKLGSYSEALIYYSHALELALPRQDPTELSYYYSNIGEVYLELYQLKDAFESELKALSYLEKLKNNNLIVETYFILVKICLELNNYERADEYLKKMHQIFLKTNKKAFEIKYQIAKAIKLKKEERFIESKNLFLLVLQEPYLSFELQSRTLIEFTEMLLESILNNKEENYYDLDEVIKKLLLLGRQKKTNSVPVFCNLAILQSRINILETRFDLAEIILKEALELCNIRNVDFFRKKIQNELDFLSNIKEGESTNLESLKSLIFEKTGTNNIFGNIREIQHLMIS